MGESVVLDVAKIAAELGVERKRLLEILADFKTETAEAAAAAAAVAQTPDIQINDKRLRG